MKKKMAITLISEKVIEKLESLDRKKGEYISNLVLKDLREQEIERRLSEVEEKLRSINENKATTGGSKVCEYDKNKDCDDHSHNCDDCEFISEEGDCDNEESTKYLKCTDGLSVCCEFFTNRKDWDYD